MKTTSVILVGMLVGLAIPPAAQGMQSVAELSYLAPGDAISVNRGALLGGLRAEQDGSVSESSRHVRDAADAVRQERMGGGLRRAGD